MVLAPHLPLPAFVWLLGSGVLGPFPPGGSGMGGNEVHEFLVAPPAPVGGPLQLSIIDDTRTLMSSQSGLANHLQADLDFHGTWLLL